MTAIPRIACSEWLLGDDLLEAWELALRAGVCGIEVVDSPHGFARRLDPLTQAATFWCRHFDGLHAAALSRAARAASELA
jgi:hypothetical protein